MPERETIDRAREDAAEGKSPSTQAGEFVREEIEHVRHGKHGARSPRQAIAIGLSKARRAGIKLPPPKKSATSESTRRKARQDEAAAARPRRRRPRAEVTPMSNSIVSVVIEAPRESRLKFKFDPPTGSYARDRRALVSAVRRRSSQYPRRICSSLRRGS